MNTENIGRGEFLQKLHRSISDFVSIFCINVVYVHFLFLWEWPKLGWSISILALVGMAYYIAKIARKWNKPLPNF